MISVVVIGRNEGERLKACLASIGAALASVEHEIIYVDAHSRDHSLRTAAQAGARCFVPETHQTTAALGRRIGAQEARGDVLLFLDGDMRLEAGFVQSALAVMREEEYDGASGVRHDIYMTDGHVSGENANYFACTQRRVVPEFGGAVMLSRAVLERAGGWAENVEAGEEAELHARLNRIGARLIELPIPMITHVDCVQGGRGLRGTIFSRRRLGHGQALRHAMEAGSAVQYIAREKALFVPYAMDWLCVVLLAISAWGGLLPMAALACGLIQALQLGAFIHAGRVRAFVSAKLFFFALPLGMASYQRRATAYREWTV